MATLCHEVVASPMAAASVCTPNRQTSLTIRGRSDKAVRFGHVVTKNGEIPGLRGPPLSTPREVESWHRRSRRQDPPFDPRLHIV